MKCNFLSKYNAILAFQSVPRKIKFYPMDGVGIVQINQSMHECMTPCECMHVFGVCFLWERHTTLFTVAYKSSSKFTKKSPVAFFLG
jgi:hypothetical protein